MIRRLLVVWFAAAMACATANLAFTVSMPQPANHLFHVTLRAEKLRAEIHDFKMPQWSPGYYGIGNYARNVLNFRAEDGSGRALPWQMVARNTWRVVADAGTVVLDLRTGDRILDVEGKPASPSVLNDAVVARKPGEKIRLQISRAGAESAVEVAPNTKKTYTLVASPSQS